VNIKITVQGREGRQAQHVADVRDDDQLQEAVQVAMQMYRKFYPDAPLIQQTVTIDRA